MSAKDSCADCSSLRLSVRLCLDAMLKFKAGLFVDAMLPFAAVANTAPAAVVAGTMAVAMWRWRCKLTSFAACLFVSVNHCGFGAIG